MMDEQQPMNMSCTFVCMFPGGSSLYLRIVQAAGSACLMAEGCFLPLLLWGNPCGIMKLGGSMCSQGPLDSPMCVKLQDGKASIKDTLCLHIQDRHEATHRLLLNPPKLSEYLICTFRNRCIVLLSF